MTSRPTLTGLLDELSRLPVQQRAVRSLLLLAPLAVVLAEIAAGAAPGVAYLLVVLVLAVLNAALPDSSFGLFLVLALAGHWSIATPDPTSAWLMVAALGILAVHVAGVLASYGPARLVLPGSLVRLWLWRAGGVAATTVLVWFGVRAVSLFEVPANRWLFAGALVLVAGWALVVGRQVLASED